MASPETALGPSSPFNWPDFTLCETCVTSRPTKGSCNEFLKAVTVWIKKPHVVNRRLCGSKFMSVSQFHTKAEVNQFVENISGVQDLQKNVNKTDFEDLSTETCPYTVILRQLIPKSEFFPRVFEVIVYDQQAKSVTFIPVNDSGGGDLSGTTNEILYSIRLLSSDDGSSSENERKVEISWSCDHENPDVPKRQLFSKWLATVLLDKLVIWSSVDNISTSVKSLRLVDVDEYQKTYTRLKNDYGRDLVKNWTESTDPQKFVYEDIAIASYLLLIWEEDRRVKDLHQKQTFVDLGCGNGLLVYILSKEGHKGLGIDLRKRKIWDTFGPGTELQEKTITPCGDHLFPEFDWILGNHSDELTPWIPVIAARSSYTCCFFVLPCCHFDFVGKFSSCEKGKSKYASYLSYVREVITSCGFRPEEDTLRIPSTKRVSYIGRSRTYGRDDGERADRERQDYIAQRCLQSGHNERVGHTQTGGEVVGDSHAEGDSHSTELSNRCEVDVSESSPDTTRTSRQPHSDNDTPQDNCPSHKKPRLEMDPPAGLMTAVPMPGGGGDGHRGHDNNEKEGVAVSPWVSHFQPRQESRVRNCQKVPEETKRMIVDAVFDLVLSADAGNIVSLDNNTRWCRGGVVPLGQVVTLFDKAVLQQLKAECGGLQTLLRNHSHIFQVTGGNVQLRDFTKNDPWEGRNPQKVKNKKQNTVKVALCWFHSHHPDGCPRATADCTFAHGTDDLRDRDVKS